MNSIMFRIGKTFQILCGVILLLLPFLPIESMFGRVRGIEGAMDSRSWFLALSILMPLSWFLSFGIEKRRDKIDEFLERLSLFLTRKVVFLLILVLFALLYLITKMVFSGTPLLIDSVIQVFQAEIFAAGLIKAKAHPFPEFFMSQHMLFEDSGWYSQYPPMHSLVLAVGVLLGDISFIPAFLGAGALCFVFLFTKEIFGTRVSLLTLLLFIISPFFLFMSASFMNHVSTLFFLSGFLFFFHRWESRFTSWYIVLASLFATGAFLSRPLTAIAFCFPFVLSAISISLKGKRSHGLIIGFVTSLLAPLSLMWYQSVTTGDPLLSGYIKLWGPGHGLGFHVSPWGDSHTPITGLRNELGDLRLLQEMLFEFPFPALLPLGFYLISGASLSIWEKRLLWSAISLPICYFFYWHRDAFLGPRFLYESILAFIPLTALVFVKSMKFLDTFNFKIGNLFHPVRLGTLVYSVLFLSFAFLLIVNFPSRYLIYQSGLKSVKVNIIEEANREGIYSGIIFAKVSWGNRLFSELRGYGLDASLTQRAYSYLDHCLLQTELDNAENQKISAQIFEERLKNLLVSEKKAPTLKYKKGAKRISEDRTLRLDPERKLSARCKDEIIYDQSPFGIYFPFLRANSPDFSNELIVVRDLRQKNVKIRDLYRGRKAYLYQKGEFMEIPN